MYFWRNFDAQSNPENHVTPTKFDMLWKAFNQGHLTSSRNQFMPNSNFSGRIISFFSYLRNVKHAILKVYSIIKQKAFEGGISRALRVNILKKSWINKSR